MDRWTQDEEIRSVRIHESNTEPGVCRLLSKSTIIDNDNFVEVLLNKVLDEPIIFD